MKIFRCRMMPALASRAAHVRTTAALKPAVAGWCRVRIALAAALGALVIASAAEAETFDLATFATPPGERTATDYAVRFADASPTTFATYTVYARASGSGDAARDFAYHWQDLVARVYRVTGELESETVDWPGGWKMTMGAAGVWGEQQRHFVALLAVYSGHGVSVPVLVMYNDDLYRPQIDKFLASIHLSAPAPGANVAAAPAAQEGSAPPALTAQEWYRSVANDSQWGFRFTAAEIARMGSQGYAKWSYRFQPDGRYTFVHEFWSLGKSDEYWFVEESGTYRQTADTLEVKPSEVRRVLRDRDGRARGQPQPLPAEPVTYRYAFQYLSGMQRWYLVLMPQPGRDTRRDGKRDDIPDYGPAYRYGPRPYCEQRPKPSDCKG